MHALFDDYEGFDRDEIAKHLKLKIKPRQVFWSGAIPPKDDFGYTIKDEFIDGRTIMGSWAMMSPEAFKLYGVAYPRLGLGYGQRYVLQTKDGRWLKVEG